MSLALVEAFNYVTKWVELGAVDVLIGWDVNRFFCIFHLLLKVLVHSDHAFTLSASLFVIRGLSKY